MIDDCCFRAANLALYLQKSKTPPIATLHWGLCKFNAYGVVVRLR